jgi:hypothetical protein
MQLINFKLIFSDFVQFKEDNYDYQNILLNNDRKRGDQKNLN